VYKRRARAQALMLLGETERALADLAASFRDDRDYTQWWYTLDHDPIWWDARSDERFRALATEVRAYAARERQAVEEMRRRGEIPRRAGAVAGPSQEPPSCILRHAASPLPSLLRRPRGLRRRARWKR